MPSQKNIDSVKSLKDKVAKAKALFMTDYRGLTHQQLEHLRRSLKKAEAEFIVSKNTLFGVAMEQSGNETMKQLKPELKNPTATLLAYKDEIEPIKILADFIKKNQLPKIKLGLFSGKLATVADFDKLASLPTREVLLATLAMRMKSPVYGFHYALKWNLQRVVTVLNNIKNQK